MKRILCLCFILLLTHGFSGCEKDDICDADTDTTPRLVIAFYDYTNPEILKRVTNLKVIAAGMENGIIFSPTFTDFRQYLISTDKIAIPLDVGQDSVKYKFILNSDNENTSLIYTDTLEFNYSRQTLYVSRACGYKVNFNLNEDNALPDPFVLNNNPNTTQGEWIKNITVEKSNLTTENETHLKIYF